MTAGEHPFAKPEGSDAEMFIQWKGTEVCLDFYCPCGYFVECPACGAIYEMGTQVIAKRVSPEAADGRALKMDPDE